MDKYKLNGHEVKAIKDETQRRLEHGTLGMVYYVLKAEVVNGLNKIGILKWLKPEADRRVEIGRKIVERNKKNLNEVNENIVFKRKGYLL